MKAKKFLAYCLMGLMAINSCPTTFAQEVTAIGTSQVQEGIIITENGVTINGTYYTKVEFENLLVEATPIAQDEQGARAIAAAGIYFIPGIGEIAIAATGAIIVAGATVAAGTWLFETISDYLSTAKGREIAQAKAKIPSRLKDGNGDVDLGKFDQKVSGKTAYKEKGGWTIEKDTAGHGGRKWKLKDKSGDRVASLGGDGEVLSK